MRDPSSANGTKTPTDWNAINWRKANRRVRNLRQRIFRAAQAGDLKKVRPLQKLMLRSYSNTLVSVRRVTQTNQGKNTAGVDKVVVKTPTARSRLVDQLMSYQLWRAQPTHRVYIPKANGQRPLGIPTILDRCQQARVKNALEPSWEARFEGSSYGFRPGRGCHDAIEKIYGLARPNKRKKWVVDADIKGAFDNLDQEFLLRTLGDVPGKELIKQWLKAGYVEEGDWHATPAGTPQGGVISPLLLNVALHGMEEALGVTYSNQGTLTGHRAVVRYADDFVVFCASRADAETIVATLTEWLGQRGLTLSTQKTRIVHLSEGFDFLGFNVRQYPAPKTSRSGWKLLIKPSKQSVKDVRSKRRAKWLQLRGSNAQAVVKNLNPIIRGWANYFRTAVAARTFHQLDYWMWQRAARYARRTHPKKSWQWLRHRYWGKFNPTRRDTWVFGDKHSGYYLRKFSWFRIERHIMVRGKAAPDDPSLRAYWQTREVRKARNLKPRHAALAQRQNYVCPLCGESLFNDEEIQEHHKKPRRQGGSDSVRNLTLVHLYCQQQIHGSKIKPRTAAGEPLLL